MTNINHDKPVNICSTQSLTDWQGSMTFFNGFTVTKPEREIQNASWESITHEICGKSPSITTDKKKGKYFVPCLLQDLPLIGKTLDNAERLGQPLVGKMRSKQHVTAASMLVLDIDGLGEEPMQAGIAKMKADQITFLLYSSYSFGNPNKTGMRVRIVVPLDIPVNNDEYHKAYLGFDQYYFEGQVTKADSSGSQLYQQQGIWMTNPEWKENAYKEQSDARIISVSALIKHVKSATPAQAESSPNDKAKYTPSDANKVADKCKQINLFRNQKGADQSEPLWNDCLGVIGHCENGREWAHQWSSDHQKYDVGETDRKLDNRLKYGPTTCAQFKKTDSKGCEDCKEICYSPITLGWQDTEQKTLNKMAENSIFEHVEPWPGHVDFAEVLASLIKLIKQHIILSDDQALAVALWITMTWCVDYVPVLPLLIINAPEKSCGKTQLLDMVKRLSLKSIPASNITQAAMYRLIEAHQPTILIDEADTFIRDRPELMGLINAGHTRTSASIIRCVGDNNEPKLFSVWGAKALAGIALEQHLKDPTMSRGIVINMRRKLSGEKIVRLRNADERIITELKQKLKKWSSDCDRILKDACPDLPEQLNDRQQDNWEPLLMIATAGGEKWLADATNAALALSHSDESVSIGSELLMTIHEVFSKVNATKLSTSELVVSLCEDEDAPWATYNKGRPITPRQIGLQLKKFRIESRTTKFDGKSLKGYFFEDFNDAFKRYLPSLSTTQ